MAKLKKYCKKCGKKLSVKIIKDGFNEYTGKELKLKELMCPYLRKEQHMGQLGLGRMCGSYMGHTIHIQ